jgi:hypothetical protein
MPSDQVVSAQDVLRSLMELRQLGSRRILETLEQEEADLVEFLLEQLGDIHRQLLNLGVSPKKLRRLGHRIEAMALVLVMPLRRSHERLWREEAADTPLAQIDPSLLADPPSAAPPDTGSAPPADPGSGERPR